MLSFLPPYKKKGAWQLIKQTTTRIQVFRGLHDEANAPNIFVNTCETQAQNLAMRL